MKSSSGNYDIGLDHVRALAVLMVFSWHFIHSHNIVPLNGSTSWFVPFSLLTQGYTGVSLFMVLSGYIFARLTDGQRLLYGQFLKNRVLRLLPLLVVVMVLVDVKSRLLKDDLNVPFRILIGWFAPSLPQGGWSITVEAHFYLLLPLILWVAAKSHLSLLALILTAVALRTVIHGLGFDVEYFSYYTLIGRIDQFLLGCLAYHWRAFVQGRHMLWAAAAACFCGLMFYVDLQGSLFSTRHDMSKWWIFMTTVEGAFYGLTIAWYSTSFQLSKGRASRFVAMIGRYSYSIYLLHTFVVFKLAEFINQKLLVIDTVPMAVLAALVSFVLFLPVAALSHRLIEAPFLKRRGRYTQAERSTTPSTPEAAPEEIPTKQAA